LEDSLSSAQPIRVATLVSAALAGGGIGLATGCAGTAYEYAGYSTHEYFAMDGNRAWEYVSDNEDTTWKMQVDKLVPVEEADSKEIVTLEYSKQDPAEYLFSVKWSADSSDGIQIHAWDDGSGWTDLDTAVNLSEYQMVPGDTVESSGGGYDFTATFNQVVSCPNHWISEDNTWDCLHFTLDDGDGDPMSGPPMAGDWWLAKGWGASSFIPTGYDEAWVLSDGDWTADSE